MKYHYRLVAVLTLCSCVISGLFAEDAPDSEEIQVPSQLEDKVFQDSLEGEMTFNRALISSQANRFSFIIPSGFSLDKIEGGKKVILTHPNIDGYLGIVIHEKPSESMSSPLAAVNAKLFDQFRKKVEARFPGSKLTDEFTVSTAGFSGPAFEVDWIPKARFVNSTRMAFVIFPGGTIEFTQYASKKEMRRLDSSFNRLLLSFRASAKGEKLEFIQLSSKR